MLGQVEGENRGAATWLPPGFGPEQARVPTNQPDGRTPDFGPRSRRLDASESLAAELVRKLEKRTDSDPEHRKGRATAEYTAVR